MGGPARSVGLCSSPVCAVCPTPVHNVEKEAFVRGQESLSWDLCMSVMEVLLVNHACSSRPMAVVHLTTSLDISATCI